MDSKIDINPLSYIQQKAAIDETKSAKALNEGLNLKAKADTESAKTAKRQMEQEIAMNKPSEAQANAMADFYNSHPKITAALGIADRVLPMAATAVGTVAGGAFGINQIADIFKNATPSAKKMQNINPKIKSNWQNKWPKVQVRNRK